MGWLQSECQRNKLTLGIERMRCRMPSLALRKIYGSINVRREMIHLGTNLLYRISQASSYQYKSQTLVGAPQKERDRTDPYNTAHIVVALRLIPTVLARMANGLFTITNTTQKKAVIKVLQASDPRRPIGDSTKYAPSYSDRQYLSVRTPSVGTSCRHRTHDSAGTTSNSEYDDVP